MCSFWGSGSGRMLWRAILHGEGLWIWSMVSNVVQGPYRVCLWQSIKNGWDTLHRFVSFKVGDGLSIKFWHDFWSREPPLKDIFPELFCVACNRDASVPNLISLSGASYQWNVNFI